MGDVMKRAVIIMTSVLTACSRTQDNPDPHRTFNRNALQFNMDVDSYVLRPVAAGYNSLFHEEVQQAVANFLTNWKEPFYAINYAFSGEVENTASSVMRFAVNSVFGCLGLFDVAKYAGLDKSETGYKETLTKWDVPNGDYLVLPFLGSSSTRDAIAEPISWFADPVGYFIGFPYMLMKAVCSVISDRAMNMQLVDDMKKDQDSAYSMMKSVYFQKFGSSDSKANDDEDELLLENE